MIQLRVNQESPSVVSTIIDISKTTTRKKKEEKIAILATLVLSRIGAIPFLATVNQPAYFSHNRSSLAKTSTYAAQFPRRNYPELLPLSQAG